MVLVVKWFVTTEQPTSLVGAAARLEAKCKLSVLYLFQGQKVSFQGHRADRQSAISGTVPEIRDSWHLCRDLD